MAPGGDVLRGAAQRPSAAGGGADAGRGTVPGGGGHLVRGDGFRAAPAVNEATAGDACPPRPIMWSPSCAQFFLWFHLDVFLTLFANALSSKLAFCADGFPHICGQFLYIRVPYPLPWGRGGGQ